MKQTTGGTGKALCTPPTPTAPKRSSSLEPWQIEELDRLAEREEAQAQMWDEESRYWSNRKNLRYDD